MNREWFIVIFIGILGFFLGWMVFDAANKPADPILCDWHPISKLELLSDQWEHVPWFSVKKGDLLRYRYDEELNAVLVERCMEGK